MDTNVKKWTETTWVKVTCFVLSLCMFVGLAGMVFGMARQYGLFGNALFLSRDSRQQFSYTDSDAFVHAFREDLLVVAGKTGHYREQMIRQQATEDLDDYADSFADTFRANKAVFIRSYIFESLCQEDIYENYAEYFNTEAVLNVPMITIEQRVLVDAYAPEFVQKVQKILNGTDGNGFLRHSDLIPEECYQAETHVYEMAINADYFSMQKELEYTLAVKDPVSYFVTEYNAFCDEISVGDYYTHGVVPESIRYFIKDPKTGETFTNCDGTETEILAEWKKSEVRACLVAGKLQQVGLDQAEKYGTFNSCFNEALDVYVSLTPDNVLPDDKYNEYFREYTAFIRQDFGWSVIAAVILAGGALAFLCLLLRLCVDRRLWIDKLFLELHLFLSVGAGSLLLSFAYNALSSGITPWLYEYRWQEVAVAAIFMAAAALGWTLVCELLCSLTRALKSGEWKENVLIFRICRFMRLQWHSFWRKVGEAFAYEAGTIKRYVFPMFGIWIGVSAVLAVLVAVYQNVVLLVLLIVLEAVIAFQTALYLSRLDRVILAAQKRTEYAGKVEELPASLRTLLESRKLTEDELKNAIEKAVRDERTKAELITNVSHDLKTPLTSVINYIELLKKCEIDDEAAAEYLAVLTEKSARLKRLIEDLIEASKVSTGNITLEKTMLSLAELVGQAVVEVEKELEERGLTLVYTPSAQPTVFADGTKIYRVLENLLSNARKYSLEGSRVYALVYEDDENGYFELKNTSKAPLDVSAEELTERFVRGDRARSEEGNGLGLSIADNLCRLNGGELRITIDGDLFKAVVRLPKK